MTAPVVMALNAVESVLKESINNSKIVNTIDKEISKALGLLVDLILLPFLPLLVFGIVQLYQAILGFGIAWRTAWKKLDEEGIAGLIKMAIENAWGALEKWWENLLAWAFSDKPLARKILDVFSGIGDSFLDTMIPTLPITWRQMFRFILGSEKMKQLSIALGILAEWAEGAIQTVIDILGFIFGSGVKALKNTLDFILSVPFEIMGLLLKILNYIFEIDTSVAQSKITAYLELLKANPLDTAWDAIKAGGAGLIKAALSVVGRAGGGPVSGGQSYIVGEKGPELFTPSSSGSISPNTGGITLNFYGYHDDVFIQKVRDVLRQDGSGYSL